MFYVKSDTPETEVPRSLWPSGLVRCNRQQCVYLVESLPAAQRLAAWLREEAMKERRSLPMAA